MVPYIRKKILFQITNFSIRFRKQIRTASSQQRKLKGKRELFDDIKDMLKTTVGDNNQGEVSQFIINIREMTEWFIYLNQGRMFRH